MSRTLKAVLVYIFVCLMGFVSCKAGGITWGTESAGLACFTIFFIASGIAVLVFMSPDD